MVLCRVFDNERGTREDGVYFYLFWNKFGIVPLG